MMTIIDFRHLKFFSKFYLPFNIAINNGFSLRALIFLTFNVFCTEIRCKQVIRTKKLKKLNYCIIKSTFSDFFPIHFQWCHLVAIFSEIASVTRLSENNTILILALLETNTLLKAQTYTETLYRCLKFMIVNRHPASKAKINVFSIFLTQRPREPIKEKNVKKFDFIL